MSDSLKIVQVGPLPPPVGGMATVVNDLVKEQGERHQLRVLDYRKTTAEDRALWQGILAQLKLVLTLVTWSVIWRPHIVHIHTCSRETFWRTSLDVLLARSLGRGVVLHIHGAEFHRFLESLRGMRSWWARRVFSLSRSVVVLGSEWKKVLTPWCPPGRVDVVPNGVPVPDAYQRPVKDDLNVVCLANYEQRKGQKYLIEAVAKLTDVRLTLLGFESEKGQQQALLDLAADLGIADRVAIPGPVMGEAKIQHYRDADVFCLPSFNEGLPMSMLEAMAEGLPVVVTSVGAIPEVIVDAENGLVVEPGKVDQLVVALKALQDDRALLARLAKTGRDLVAHEYSVARVGRQLDEIYKRLL